MQTSKQIPTQSDTNNQNNSRCSLTDIIVDWYVVKKRGGDMSALQSNNNMVIYIHEKNQSLIVSDGRICMDAVMKTRDIQTNQQKPLRPFSHGFRSDYYNFSNKIAKYYNFTDSKLPHTAIKYPDINRERIPYFPEFHFNVRFSKFCQERTKLQYQTIETIKIKEFDIRTVNIANTGYYAPLLQIYAYEKISSKEKPQILTSLTNILYQPLIQCLMNNLRLIDMRKQLIKNAISKNKEDQISLFYYMKNSKIQRKQAQLSEFIYTDKVGKFVKTNPKEPQVYIALGELSGVYRFIRPIASGINDRFRLSLDVKALEALQENRRHKKIKTSINEPIQAQSESQKSDDDSLWSEDDAYQHTAHHDRNRQYNEIDEQYSDYESGSSQNEQPLKVMYLQQLKNMKII